jgi:hypothetical protein
VPRIEGDWSGERRRRRSAAVRGRVSSVGTKIVRSEE